ncbi:MAG: hypothetical protein IT437_12505 [Phycisphaerales bacterium]|nr:hypothetical protein [Phycisphaerales bacterium]
MTDPTPSQPHGHTMPVAPGHRPASVTLRQGGPGGDSGSLMDPANQSLAEALRITFWILQLGMLVIFGLFLLSGFQTVKENEKGIRLLFGRVTSDQPLDPGFQFSWPYPIGELVKVGTGDAVQVEIDEAFWPSLTTAQKTQSIAELAPTGGLQLKPGTDGSLITSDRALAHTKWSVLYTRVDPTAYARNIAQEGDQEIKIVRAAVERGVVQAMANTTIDDLLRQTSGEQGAVAQRARQVAQESLDRVGSGLRIDTLTLRDKIPPLSVVQAFSNVQSAEQKASQAREKAEGDARNTLQTMAGAAHPYLMERIAAYEKATDTGDAAGQERLMGEIEDLLDGRPVTEDGRTLENLVSGKVTLLMNEAEEYRSTIVSKRRGELALFRAKLEQFRASPRVVVQRDWSDAMATLLARDSVEAFMLPAGMTTLDVLLNPDPELRKAMDRARKLRENQEAEKQREHLAEQSRFTTDTEKRVVKE